MRNSLVQTAEIKLMIEFERFGIAVNAIRQLLRSEELLPFKNNHISDPSYLYNRIA